MYMKYLQSDPDIAGGNLTIKGTRIRIGQVITMLATGHTIAQLHTEWFPHLTEAVLRGAVEEAAQHLSVQPHA